MSTRHAPQLQTLPGMEPPGAPPSGDGPALTIEQEQAITRRAEPLLVSAAAGSGKTSVLVERFVRAVREDGVAPGRILAITFTERAAGELRERVRARLLGLGERQAARDTEAAFVGTFHGFCARLLRAQPLAAGVDPDFAVLEEGLAGRLRRRAFEQAVRAWLAEDRGEAADVLAAYGVDRVGGMLEQVYLELRSRGERLPRLPAAALNGDATEEQLEAAGVCALLGELLEHFGLVYERLKRARSAVDFDDLELLAQRLLLEREAVRTAWAERFELLMVDEFQDTNPRQLAILRALDRENLFTVGDELQSIYGFRYADVSLFRARRTQLAGARRQPAADVQLPQSRRAAGRRQRRLRRALRRHAEAHRGSYGRERARFAARCRAAPDRPRRVGAARAAGRARRRRIAAGPGLAPGGGTPAGPAGRRARRKRARPRGRDRRAAARLR